MNAIINYLVPNFGRSPIVYRIVTENWLDGIKLGLTNNQLVDYTLNNSLEELQNIKLLPPIPAEIEQLRADGGHNRAIAPINMQIGINTGL